ncbi:hypothetical protein HanIR_Chr08g0368901 [Helianthus annuus]|nr:hypothetical protein HanIR_Chr08g0368901 [Helianthus annuus]
MRVDLCKTANMNNRVLAESRSPHKMEDWVAINRKSRFLIVKHDTPVGVDPEKVTHVALFGLTVSTLFAFSSENREHMIPGL